MAPHAGAVSAPLLPWNLTDEIVAQQTEYLSKGGAFLVPGSPPRLVGAGGLP